MKIIRDGRLLNRLSREFHFEYDRKYKYITTEPVSVVMPTLHLRGYCIKYFDGCFYPFLCKKEK